MDKTYENRIGYLIADVARPNGRLFDRRAKRIGLTGRKAACSRT